MSFLPDTSCLLLTLGSKAHTIWVGPGLLDQIGAGLSEILQNRTVFVLTDSHVKALVADRVVAALQAQGRNVRLYAVPAGEATKSFADYQRVVEWMLECHIDRHSVVLAIGGGVVGDLAGFAAATVLRGVRLIHIPTTLLAQVDSAIGGKNGLNTTQGKNLVGTLHQPEAVVIDPTLLRTLPAREFWAGYAEVYKHGLIRDAGYAAWLDSHLDQIRAQDPKILTEAIMRSCQIKVDIVAADEKEQTDLRALLNFGHTFGHALEALCGYDSRLLHGEAVAIGMVMAAALSVKVAGLDAAALSRIEKHLKAAGLPTRVSDIPHFKTTAQEMIDRMKYDKKAQGGLLAFVLLRAVGDAFVSRDVKEIDVRAVLKDLL